jgi:hypothetical protein
MIGLDLSDVSRSPVALIRRGIHFGSYGSVDDGAAVFGRLTEAARAGGPGADPGGRGSARGGLP